MSFNARFCRLTLCVPLFSSSMLASFRSLTPPPYTTRRRGELCNVRWVFSFLPAILPWTPCCLLPVTAPSGKCCGAFPSGRPGVRLTFGVSPPRRNRARCRLPFFPQVLFSYLCAHVLNPDRWNLEGFSWGLLQLLDFPQPLIIPGGPTYIRLLAALSYILSVCVRVSPHTALAFPFVEELSMLAFLKCSLYIPPLPFPSP